MGRSGAVDGLRSRMADIRLRFGYTIAAANLTGGGVVFALLAFVIPLPRGLAPSQVLPLNAAVFVGFGLIGVRTGWVWSARRWKRALGWAASGREPSRDERERTLRFPLSQQVVTGTLWGASAVVFTAVNLPYSVSGAAEVAVTIVLGALVTSALEYLLAERLLRPLAVVCLAAEVPARPQLPGVATRALLSWTLGTGAVLLGLVLLGVGDLLIQHETASRLAVVVIVLSSIGIGVGLLLTAGLARSVSERIESLRDAISKLEQGDFDGEVTVDDASEVGLLQAGFNRMVSGLREREHIRDLFGRHVGEDVVRHALEHGVDFDGEAREAAVLFVDLKGSTKLAESRDPADVVSLLNAFFEVVVEVADHHEGWVNKFEGDAALCVFGAPLADEQAADHALAAAREMRDRFRADLEDLTAGIGVSAGRVVAGNIGAAERFEYTVIGDPVNEAARLTELAKESSGGALASQAALERVAGGEAELWTVCDEVTLRGRSSPTTVARPAD
jgi:adenylate cyclase